MSATDHDMHISETEVFFLPVSMRMPLKFGNQVLTRVKCARAKVTVEDSEGNRAEGWGETPLSVGWVWPAALPYEEREQALEAFTLQLVEELGQFPEKGHAFEVGHAFIENKLGELQTRFNADRAPEAHLPHLAALVCFSALDIALHDAYGNLNGVPVYQTYNSNYLKHDLSHYLEEASGSDISFKGKFPEDFFVEPASTLPVWHLVGGLDPITSEELTGEEPEDDYPVLLRDWIQRDGLNCLKVKLRGNDESWDFQRLVQIGQICAEENVEWLTADFNCAATDPEYVNRILDKLKDEHPRVYQAILYVEQPFPYDLEANRIDVHSVSARKPLFMDESAHDWKFVRMGRELGWNGVALKTCKTQTGALLSLCWAKAHGMTLMVQDLTNPMIAQVPHVLLAAHAGTIMGVESNGMQFYPDASLPEKVVHPGLYQRRNGILDLSTLGGSGFGYRLGEIERELPASS
ncbi:MAG: mandelate racemase/muconate lactonizing enzyme family protein [Verrucomicrobiota bacterium]